MADSYDNATARDISGKLKPAGYGIDMSSMET